MKTNLCLVFITASSDKEAGLIAGSLINKRIAACVNIVPNVRSVFFWQDKKNEANEIMLIVKTIHKNIRALIADVKTLHSYEVPEVIAIPIVDGSEEFLEWVERSCEIQK